MGIFLCSRQEEACLEHCTISLHYSVPFHAIPKIERREPLPVRGGSHIEGSLGWVFFTYELYTALVYALLMLLLLFFISYFIIISSKYSVSQIITFSSNSPLQPAAGEWERGGVTKRLMSWIVSVGILNWGTSFRNQDFCLKKKKSLLMENKHGVQDRERSEINLIFQIQVQQLLSASIFYSLTSC